VIYKIFFAKERKEKAHDIFHYKGNRKCYLSVCHVVLGRSVVLHEIKSY